MGGTGQADGGWRERLPSRGGNKNGSGWGGGFDTNVTGVAGWEGLWREAEKRLGVVQAGGRAGRGSSPGRIR
eukprot:5582138-Pleurochrysis_carterae.AAC.1